jgi:hypothetical protein
VALIPSPARRRPVQQTSAEFTKELLMPSGHYKVEFTGLVSAPRPVDAGVIA